MSDLNEAAATASSAAFGEAMSATKPYTRKEYKEFKRLVMLAESSRQMDRIIARLEQPKFIEQVGREKCDLMFEELKREKP